MVEVETPIKVKRIRENVGEPTMKVTVEDA
jgi:hypothetical protein